MWGKGAGHPGVWTTLCPAWGVDHPLPCPALGGTQARELVCVYRTLSG